MLTKRQVRDSDDFHLEGKCETSVDLNGNVRNFSERFSKSSKFYEWKRLDKFQVSIRPNDGGDVRQLTKETAYLYHAQEDCPLNPKIYSLNSHPITLCLGHKQVREFEMNTALESNERSKEKCIDCLIIEHKFFNEDKMPLDLLAVKTLVDSMVEKDRSSVRWGIWSKGGNLWEFKTPENARTCDEIQLSFSQYGDIKMVPEQLIEIERNSKKSEWLTLIQDAVNQYLKENPLDGGD